MWLQRLKILTSNTKALAASNIALDNTALRRIASSTYGILFFGCPVNATKELNSMIVLSSAGSGSSTESSEIRAMKRDAKWLQTTNLHFNEIASRYKMTYFRELPGDMIELVDNVWILLFFLHYISNQCSHQNPQVK
jgi:hypothetical protein